MSGVLGAALGSPFFQVKTRLQSRNPQSPIGVQHNYRNMFDGLGQIYRSGGVRALFGGAQAAMMRTGVGSSVQLASYDKCKLLLVEHANIKNRLAVAFGASLTSGMLVCIAMNPFDVVMTRLYNQSQTSPQYANPVDCLLKTVRAEGFAALYKGFGAHYLRIGPHTVLTFMFLEQLTHLVKSMRNR